MSKTSYKWKVKDKWRYALSLIPFILLSIATIYIIFKLSVFMAILWILLFIVVNLFQAGCCVGCPYRGSYCPAFFGVYLGNVFSTFLYQEYEFDEKFFRQNALGGEISLLIFLLFPVYWLYVTQWYYPLIYFALILLHIVLFLPSQCKKCSYNDTCPGGKSYNKICSWFRR